VFGGVNGAGKTTVATELLKDVLKVPVFTNADAIARGLNALDVESVAFQAGRSMLNWMHTLARDRKDFAFETTLAARSYAVWLKELKQSGYEVYVYYYWLPSPEVAIERVRLRVERGGHHIPERDIRRRYSRSVWNFLNLYRDLADHWEVWNNTTSPRTLIALGKGEQCIVDSDEVWSQFTESSHARE